MLWRLTFENCEEPVILSLPRSPPLPRLSRLVTHQWRSLRWGCGGDILRRMGFDHRKKSDVRGSGTPAVFPASREQIEA